MNYLWKNAGIGQAQAADNPPPPPATGYAGTGAGGLGGDLVTPPPTPPANALEAAQQAPAAPVGAPQSLQPPGPIAGRESSVSPDDSLVGMGLRAAGRGIRDNVGVLGALPVVGPAARGVAAMVGESPERQAQRGYEGTGTTIGNAYRDAKTGIADLLRGNDPYSIPQLGEMFKTFELNPSQNFSPYIQQRYDENVKTKGEAGGAEVMQAVRPVFDATRSMAVAALTNNDVPAAMKFVDKMHELMPDNTTHNTAFDQKTGMFTVNIQNPLTKEANTFNLTPAQFKDYASGAASQFDHVAHNGAVRNLQILTTPTMTLPDGRVVRTENGKLTEGAAGPKPEPSTGNLSRYLPPGYLDTEAGKNALAQVTRGGVHDLTDTSDVGRAALVKDMLRIAPPGPTRASPELAGALDRPQGVPVGYPAAPKSAAWPDRRMAAQSETGVRSDVTRSQSSQGSKSSVGKGGSSSEENSSSDISYQIRPTTAQEKAEGYERRVAGYAPGEPRAGTQAPGERELAVGRQAAAGADRLGRVAAVAPPAPPTVKPVSQRPLEQLTGAEYKAERERLSPTDARSAMAGQQFQQRVAPGGVRPPVAPTAQPAAPAATDRQAAMTATGSATENRPPATPEQAATVLRTYTGDRPPWPAPQGRQWLRSPSTGLWRLG